jgi:DNA modification methylase
MPCNTLYYGDNLEVLQQHIADESVDLVYLDPPFNSDADYNMLFKEKDGKQAAAQIKAFNDTWHWDQRSARAFEDVVEAGGKVSDAMQAFRKFLGENDMLAYLSMMAPRLKELHRKLKPTGSMYLHCDPTASHYLKMLMDAVFTAKQFLNEITWKRSSAHSDTKQGMRRCGRIRDIILFYSKTGEHVWHPEPIPYTEKYLDSEYRHIAPDGRRYKETDLTAARPGGDTEYEWHVKRPPTKGARWEADLNQEYRQPQVGVEYRSVLPYTGRYWAYSYSNMVDFAKQGKLIHRETGMPRLMQFADEMPGVSLQDLWDDIPPAMGDEDLGYPTQKPLKLLKRIICASSNPGDIILDPFCGCGTTVAGVEELNQENPKDAPRVWLGIDITHLAVNLIKFRLHDSYGDSCKYKVVGEPTSLPDAKQLAAEDPYQFQFWALGRVNARPREERRGADKGVDGRLLFHDEPEGGQVKQVVISVKAGENVSVAHVRDLRGVLDREKAQIGVLLSMKEPTEPMKNEAASAGFYDSPWGTKHPRLQLLTIEELLAGRKIDMPPTRDERTFAKALKFRAAPKRQSPLPFDEKPET